MGEHEGEEYFKNELWTINELGDNYDLITKLEAHGDSKIFLEGNLRKKCRFCGENYPEVKFSTESHAIPEFLGNKILISLYECDVCNERFSRTVEDHFAKYLGLARTVNMLKGKKNKIASYKHDDSRIDVKEGRLVIQESLGNNELYKENPELKEITLKSYRQPYIPAAVFKCLVKMALSIMPENEVSNFEETLSWLSCKEHDMIILPNLYLYVTFVPGPKPFPFITNYLYRRKAQPTKDNLFYMLYVVTFGSWVFQVHLPLSSPDMHLVGKDVQVPHHLARFPIGYQEIYGRPKVSVFDFSSIKEERGDGFEIILSYEKKIEGEDVLREARRLLE